MNAFTKVIGGGFGLDFSEHGSPPPFLNQGCIYFLNARSAMLALFKTLRPAKVWMPSYFCPSMLIPPNILEIPIRFFPVDERLNIQEGRWLSEVQPDDIVVVIDYFGFRPSEWIWTAVKERGALILEDASQALLSSHVRRHADFVVYSPRKIVGVPDGGILWCRNACPISPDRSTIPSDWWAKAFRARLLRRDFDTAQSHGDRKWFHLFKEADANAPIGNYGASPLTISIVETAIDWDTVTKTRRANYQDLLDELGEYALFSELPGDVVPLCFPITSSNREELRQALFAENIYPPIHWEFSNSIPKEFAASHRLSQCILSLICDQRYTRDDMRLVSEIVKKNCKAK